MLLTEILTTTDHRQHNLNIDNENRTHNLIKESDSCTRTETTCVGSKNDT